MKKYLLSLLMLVSCTHMMIVAENNDKNPELEEKIAQAFHELEEMLGGSFELNPFQEAVRVNDIEKVKELIAHGANVNQQDIFGDPEIHYAIALKNVEMVELLIASGANLEIEGANDMPALFEAILSVILSIVEQAVMYQYAEQSKNIDIADALNIIQILKNAGAPLLFEIDDDGKMITAFDLVQHTISQIDQIKTAEDILSLCGPYVSFSVVVEQTPEYSVVEPLSMEKININIFKLDVRTELLKVQAILQ
jgi:Ankyrin repeats (many copies)